MSLWALSSLSAHGPSHNKTPSVKPKRQAVIENPRAALFHVVFVAVLCGSAALRLPNEAVG